MLTYRFHRGNFDAWKRFQVVIDDTKTIKISDGELIEINGNKHKLDILKNMDTTLKHFA